MDLFSGSGGLSTGAVAAGLEVLLGVDSDKWAVDTYSKNFGPTKAKCADLKVAGEDFFEQLPRCDLLVAGPPCQSFSTSNQKTRNDSNPLNNLLFVPVLAASVIRPTAVVVENVHGLGIGSRRKYLDELTVTSRTIAR